MAARKLKHHHQEDVKAKIQVSALIHRLNKHISGDVELSQTQLKAIEMLLARTMPTLTAVEQTTLNPDDKLTEDQIMAKFQQLIDSFPDLLTQLLAERAKDAPGIKAA